MSTDISQVIKQCVAHSRCSQSFFRERTQALSYCLHDIGAPRSPRGNPVSSHLTLKAACVALPHIVSSFPATLMTRVCHVRVSQSGVLPAELLSSLCLLGNVSDQSQISAFTLGLLSMFHMFRHIANHQGEQGMHRSLEFSHTSNLMCVGVRV